MGDEGLEPPTVSHGNTAQPEGCGNDSGNSLQNRGFDELIHHWNHLSDNSRQSLLSFAKQLLIDERAETVNTTDARDTMAL